MSFSEHLNEPTPRVVIIGAGAGGIACGISLKRKYGLKNFTIYEKAGEVGGTWRENIYPGCSSDVPMPFYSLSTDLHDWKQSHGSHEEILEYWIHLTKKYGLYPHIELNRKVQSAEWDSALHCYRIVTEDTVTGEQFASTAQVVISAIGVLETPRYASIPGLANFKGEMFHSARWNNDIDLSGKRVAVVGNGASATQFVPCITDDPKVKVIQFCRTPNWLMPPIRSTYSPARRWLTRNMPLLNRLLRWSFFLRLEMMYFGIFGSGLLRRIITMVAKAYIKHNAPKEYLSALIPSFPLGCKRVIFDTDYLAALHRPNLDLNWDGIEAIVEEGVLTKKGERIPCDVLIFATGYAADFYPFPLTGLRGQSIQKYYEAEEGPKAYLGTAVPGFPNFFMIFGPNTATGHTSVIYTNEVQINYIMQLIKPILEKKVLSLEVDVEPTDAYNDKIHSRLSKSVFTQCVSWYRVGGKGKITNAFPAAATVFWLWLPDSDECPFCGRLYYWGC
ncbi:hypothetical protein B0H34DRAFT_289614 [Crassisporium funariophilum]|nr:hypothetical protein B0H34DRAFT_289614 [Crassisporium funariophilum]